MGSCKDIELKLLFCPKRTVAIVAQLAGAYLRSLAIMAYKIVEIEFQNRAHLRKEQDVCKTFRRKENRGQLWRIQRQLNCTIQ